MDRNQTLGEGGAVKKEGDPVIQFSVMLQNKVGAFGALLSLLRCRGVEVIGMSAQDSCDATVVRLVVSDPDTTQHIFYEKGIAHTVSDLIVVALSEAGEGLAQCLEVLASSETNVDFGYALMAHPERQCLMALHLDDHDFGRRVLTQAGYQVMYQQDLSR